MTTPPADHLMQSLNLLAEAQGSFDMIVWCPDEHVLSFRRVGSWQWVNIWFHAEDVDTHSAEPNHGEYGWGGRNPQVIWVDGKWPESGSAFVFNMPQRRMDGTQNPISELAPGYEAERFTHIDQLPPVPGAVTGGRPS